ncbi:lysophospholipid acyltransferase family protein [Arundinibacter roseus]|uniref:1-acyl-sn-glycerol-3-phosphate acyltransferase n=1 Tax=Arundinibacter roseus TaxID=2070510 RepID=A0A4R4KHF0_9BACT|nr:lysophospholipid acyltransferase family protein [Arundinibacter roseus]TDB66071.1 1-acyl-sn-glycerol-3-phosphate acyltransferase [Arundinibacter roseus]
MRIFLLLYTLWCAFWFILLFLILFPFTWLFLQKDRWKPFAHQINRVWGRLFFPLIGMPVRVEYRFKPARRETFVICANHFSYLDIATMGVVVDNYFAFVGKHAVKKVPLFGYMFRKLHIQVDREKGNSRAYSLSKSIRTLASGRSVMIFPEGGIITKNAPQIHLPLQKGAFVMAIQQQVPLLPVSLQTNHVLLPDRSPLRLRPGVIRAVVHAPIPTVGLTQADVPDLMEKWRQVVQGELNK